MPEMNRKSLDEDSSTKETGLILAVVVSHLDPDYMGSLQVEKLRQVGNDAKRTGQLASVKYISPFLGITNFDSNSKENVYEGTQKSYGMWMVPPDIGTVVVCVFVEGDPARGYYLGCIQQKDMNFMIPGYAATSFHTTGIEKRVPVAEFNKKADIQIKKDTTQIEKPPHPYFTEVYKNQGLLRDDIRGITTSSARREWPSSVFGISTPGPVDKDGPMHRYGKKEYEVTNLPFSRLGGSSFVMDDGDDKFLRIKSASEGPPEYAAVEDGDTDGNRKLLHNELIRIRTRTGHQILMHNTEDLIYIGNAKGTAWIELTSDGKMDIYCEDSISVHTKNDLNFYADRDINMEAGRNFNIKVAEEMHTNVLKDHILIVDENQKIHIKKDVDITYDKTFQHKIKEDVNIQFDSKYLHKVGSDYDFNAGGHIYMTSGGSNETNAGGGIIESAPVIHMNGPTAATAAMASEAELPKVLKTHSVPDENGSTLFNTIMRRVPTHEPWPHHENLDPEQFKSDKTNRDVDERYEDNSESILLVDKDLPIFWPGWPPSKHKYTTKYDTFSKVKK
jgi:hypothetical protein